MLNKIIRELKKIHLKGEIVEREHNGIMEQGIRIDLGQEFAPVYYVDKMIEDGYTAKEIANNIKELIDLSDVPTFNAKEAITREYILKNVMPKLSTNFDKNLFCEKSEFEGIYITYCVDIEDENFHYPLNDEMIKDANLSKKEVKEQAHKNLKKIISIDSMVDKLQLLNINTTGIQDMIIISNKRLSYGASSVLEWRNILKKRNKKYAVMVPASIHTALLFPCDSEEEMDIIYKEKEEILKSKKQTSQSLGKKVFKLVM
jgi:hypothetical protein